MNIRANTETKFLLKYLLIGLACLIFGLWCLIDGLSWAPARIPRSQAWQDVQEKYPEAEWAPKWRELSKEKGWDPKRPKKDESVSAIKSYIIWQWVMLVGTSLVGIPCLIWWFMNKGTWVETTEDGVTSSWGKGFKCADVTKFDKRKWEKKGIGVIHYEEDGSVKTFVLDDLKYERVPMDKIVGFVEENIDRDSIVNGVPESESSVAIKNETSHAETAEGTEIEG